jgi:hypothetical protein
MVYRFLNEFDDWRAETEGFEPVMLSADTSLLSGLLTPWYPNSHPHKPIQFMSNRMYKFTNY